jgi:hypothetical protein
MKNWLPRDEELSDAWHTLLTLALYSIIALPLGFVGFRAILTLTMEPFWTDLQGYGLFGRQTLHGARAFFAGLSVLHLSGVFVMFAISDLRHVSDKSKFQRIAWILLAVFFVSGFFIWPRESG